MGERASRDAGMQGCRDVGICMWKQSGDAERNSLSMSVAADWLVASHSDSD